MTIESSLAMPGARIRAGAALGVFSGVVFSQLIGMVEAWQARRVWRIDLSRLDDHMLRDIGLERADAEVEIAKPFWRR